MDYELKAFLEDYVRLLELEIARLEYKGYGVYAQRRTIERINKEYLGK